MRSGLTVAAFILEPPRERIASLDTNPLPLLLTISETFAEKSPVPSLQERIVHAAVHGWMEGHLAAPGHRLDPAYAGDMPAAPFPDPHDRRLGQIIKESVGRFGDGEEPAAVAFAPRSLGSKGGRLARNAPDALRKGTTTRLPARCAPAPVRSSFGSQTTRR